MPDIWIRGHFIRSFEYSAWTTKITGKNYWDDTFVLLYL